ncbi:MAG: rhodanese-like domain-containing protein [Leptospirales bacterium]
MKYIKKLSPVVIAMVLVFSHCTKEQKSGGSPVVATSPLEISIQDFIDEYGDDGNIQILDVRTQGEYDAGRVPGTVLLPLNELTAGAQVPFDKDSEIFVICASGNRSMAAVSFLKQQGFNEAVSVAGGTNAWIAEGKQVEK